MNTMSDLSLDKYVILLDGLKEKIRRARMRAALNVNTELLLLYWEIGKLINDQEIQEKWGAKTVERLAADLNAEFNDMKGLSKRNLRYMRDFAIGYPEFSILQHGAAKLQLTDFQEGAGINKQQAILLHSAAKLPWGHHQLILDKVKSKEHRYFYITKAVTEQWNRAVLTLQINSELYERNGKAISNFSNTLPATDSDLAIETFKNPYVFDFLMLGEQAKEKDLERALIGKLKNFMLELGKGFAYVGNQYNLNVEGDDFFLDLLFFNINLNCYVILELKIGEFKPEYTGQLNFYINAVNEQVRATHHKPTIGILLCKTPNENVVKLSLTGIDQPMGVSDYMLAEAMPKELKGEMPSIEELEAEIEKEYEELKNPSEKKLDRIKELAKKINSEKISEKKNDPKSLYLFQNVFNVQQQMLWNAVKDEIAPMFKTVYHSWRVERQGFDSFGGAEQQLLKHPSSHEFYYELRLEGFLDAGVNTFNCYAEFKFYLDHYHYQAQDRYSQGEKYIYKKLYHQNPSHEEMSGMTEHFKMELLNQIEGNLERITKEEK